MITHSVLLDLRATCLQEEAQMENRRFVRIERLSCWAVTLGSAETR
jgi:hypothetical protein